MAGIKAPIVDILVKLKSVNGILYTGIWNNQVKYEHQGVTYDFPKPAAFLEVIHSPQYEEAGMGMQSADIGWRVHLVHEQLDAADGTMDQNLAVFDLRDTIVRTLSFFEPTACGPLLKKAEGLDYDHDNIYHYVIDFICNFMDSSGSKLDPDAGVFIDKVPPTALEIDINLVDSIETPDAQPISNNNYNIPQ